MAKWSLVCAGEVEVGEEEAKLIEMPRDGSVLVAEIRQFAQERGCVVSTIRVRNAEGFFAVSWMLMGSLGIAAVDIEIREEVREGCVLLVE